jgi:hypothetical protein
LPPIPSGRSTRATFRPIKLRPFGCLAESLPTCMNCGGFSWPILTATR